MPFLEQAALRICDREQSPETPSFTRIAIKKCRARRRVVRQIVVTALQRAGNREVAEIERPRGPKINRRAERAFVDLRGRSLAHRERGEELRGENVEVESTLAIRAARAVGAARGGQPLHAIQANAREGRPEAANRNVPALAGVARDRDSRNPL